jgi:hypothetical protein
VTENKQWKAQRQNQWFKETAGAADIEIDEICLDDNAEALASSQQNAAEVRFAKARLQVLLSQPMQTQKFGKFLSTNSALVQNISTQYVGNKPKKKRRRN